MGSSVSGQKPRIRTRGDLEGVTERHNQIPSLRHRDSWFLRPRDGKGDSRSLKSMVSVVTVRVVYDGGPSRRHLSTNEVPQFHRTFLGCMTSVNRTEFRTGRGKFNTLKPVQWLGETPSQRRLYFTLGRTILVTLLTYLLIHGSLIFFVNPATYTMYSQRFNTWRCSMTQHFNHETQYLS